VILAPVLRIGEAIKLDRSDVEWAQGVLLIRESKFGKSRLVPLHPSSMQALESYARLGDQLQPRPAAPDSPYDHCAGDDQPPMRAGGERRAGSRAGRVYAVGDPRWITRHEL
jgi:integrase